MDYGAWEQQYQSGNENNINKELNMIIAPDDND